MTMESSFAACLLDPALPPPAGLKTWNGSGLGCRFDIYRNNVVVSLVNALKTSFPVTLALVGLDFFQAMARVYVSHSPPRSRLLAEYGDTFPDFIAAFPPASALPYLADVARLEYLRVQSYHAADATPLSADAFRHLLSDPDGLPGLRIKLHPACRWLHSSHAVFSLWAGHQGAVELGAVDIDVAEAALVIRPAFEVSVLLLAPGAVVWLEALSRGMSLAQASDRAAAADEHFDLPRHLAGLIEHGLATGLIFSQGSIS